MKQSYLALLALAIGWVSPATAGIIPGTGFYIGVSGGVVDAGSTTYSTDVTIPGSDVSLPGSNVTSGCTVDCPPDTGLGGDAPPTPATIAAVTGRIGTASSALVMGTVGYDFGLIRADVELSYARNRLNSVSVEMVNGTAVTSFAASGITSADACGTFTDGACSVSGNTVSFDGGAKVRQLNAFANAWVDIPVGRWFHPYAGGGLGIAAFESETSGDPQGKAVFAWQLGAGVAFDVLPKIAITADYRHRESDALGTAFDDGFTYGRVKTNVYMVGVRLKL